MGITPVPVCRSPELQVHDTTLQVTIFPNSNVQANQIVIRDAVIGYRRHVGMALVAKYSSPMRPDSPGYRTDMLESHCCTMFVPN